MKKIFLFLFCVSVFALTTEAQVTIGTTNPPQAGSVLDLQSTTLGFLPPRVQLVNPSFPSPLPTHVAGMVVYNTKEPVAVTDTLQVGLYYNTGTKWIRLFASNTETKSWFYMPSVVLNVEDTGDPALTYKKDLYQHYKQQKSNKDASTLYRTSKTIASEGAPNAVPFPIVPSDTSFYYYVTGYDDTVFDEVTISKKGELSYKIIGTASDSTFMNIIFVEK